jgi:Bacterial dnaA  protein
MARAAARAAQAVLPLDWSAGGSNDPPLVTGRCNRDALSFLADFVNWPVRCAALVGPPQSGRSLIGRAFARVSGGRVIDGLGNTSEEAMFHAWNEAQASGRPLLIIADDAPGHWTIALPDLRSRLAAVPVVRIDAPDDAYIRDCLTAQFAQRGISLAPDVAGFVAHRLHRSHAALVQVVTLLDAAALGQGRRIGKKLAGEVLREAGLIHADLVDQAGGCA